MPSASLLQTIILARQANVVDVIRTRQSAPSLVAIAEPARDARSRFCVASVVPSLMVCAVAPVELSPRRKLGQGSASQA